MGSTESKPPFWGKWCDYEKVKINDREYAQVGKRLYTRHAVDYMQPSGRRTIGGIPRAPGEGGGSLSSGRSIMPSAVEAAILGGSTNFDARSGTLRTIHRLGEIHVVTERDGEIVVSIRYERNS